MTRTNGGPTTGEGAASEPPKRELDRESTGSAEGTEASPPDESDPIDLDTVRDRAS